MSAKLNDILAQAAARKTAGQKKRGPGKGAKPAKGLYARLGELYAAMEQAYNASAAEAGLSCAGCTDNCCTSFFRHHTYVEWAYLWRGLQELDEVRRKEFADRAQRYAQQAKAALDAGLEPTAMCPVNEGGLCALYPHRLMICRMHGTRNVFSLPDGRKQFFPGCIRFTALPCAQETTTCPTLDRTPLYSELAALEMEFLRKAGKPLPRVNLTIAEMILLGPPRLS